MRQTGRRHITDASAPVWLPDAAGIMNMLVLTAVLWALNAGVFSSNRMFYNRSLQKNVPAFLSEVNSRCDIAGRELKSLANCIGSIAGHHSSNAHRTRGVPITQRDFGLRRAQVV